MINVDFLSRWISKYNKIGRAYIPTIQSSVFCNNSFISENKTELLMDCKYDKSKNGWIPININYNKKRPDLATKTNYFTQKIQQ